jgi:hypothetical protein
MHTCLMLAARHFHYQHLPASPALDPSPENVYALQGGWANPAGHTKQRATGSWKTELLHGMNPIEYAGTREAEPRPGNQTGEY